MLGCLSRPRCDPFASTSQERLSPCPAAAPAGFRTDGDRDAVTVLSRPNTITIPQPNGRPSVVIKVPESIQEVDNGHTVGFGADLAEDHPVSEKHPRLGSQQVSASQHQESSRRPSCQRCAQAPKNNQQQQQKPKQPQWRLCPTGSDTVHLPAAQPQPPLLYLLLLVTPGFP